MDCEARIPTTFFRADSCRLSTVLLLMLLATLPPATPFRVVAPMNNHPPRWLTQQQQQPSESLSAAAQYHRTSHHRLYATFSSSSSSSSSQQKKPTQQKPRILYQTIVRPAGTQTDLEFLGDLVSFLQQDDVSSILPERLPMVYETEVPDNNGDDELKDPAVLRWNSPLSPQPDATALTVQVLAIEPGGGGESPTTSTTLAMVTVQKSASSQRSFCQLPPLLQGLFADSEQQICRALDQALLEFSSSSSQQRRTTPPKSSPTADWMGELFDEEEEALLAANRDARQETAVVEPSLVETETVRQQPSTTTDRTKKTMTQRDIVDAEILSEQETTENDTTHHPDLEAKRKPATAPVPNKDDMSSSSDVVHKNAMSKTKQHSPKSTVAAQVPQTDTSDFAVRAARNVAQQQKEEGFAVAAARRAAAQRKQQPKKKVQESSAEARGERPNNPQPSVVANNMKKEIPWNGNDKTTTPASLRPENVGSRDVFQTIHKPGNDNNNETATTSLGIAQNEKMSKVLASIRTQFASSSSRNKKQRLGRESPSSSSVAAATTTASSTSTSTTIKKPQASEPDASTNKVRTSNTASAETSQKTVDMGSSRKDPARRKSNDSPLKKLNKLKSPLSSKKKKKEVVTRNLVEEEQRPPSKEPSQKKAIDAEIVSSADTPAPTVNRKPTISSDSAEEDARVQAVLEDPRVQDEAVQSIKDALDEMQSSPDMTPEQLLNDVMTFGESKKKEEEAGNGFVSGAFEKAKELLREQKRQRDEQLQASSSSSSQTKVVERNPDIPRPKTTEDELKELFQAGERFADGKISFSAATEQETKTKDPNSTTEQQEVDALLAAEKDVSDYARVLEDELVELEVRLNKSPGEELDGPPKNPRFDIFSGPEVYNPNVDPETAVNWPGALPGTKKQRLPKELEEAVTQAQFAADSLSKMEETVSGDGSTVFMLGDQEISSDQAKRLRKVVTDAVAIGLIRDPLHLMAERSRLQMLLDELWTQPEDRTKEVAMNYKDLLLSENFVELIRERMAKMVERDLEALRNSSEDEPEDDALEERHSRERDLLGQLVVHTQLFLKEAHALGAELEAQQLEVIRSICKVAMDPSHQTEEETAMALTDAVRDMRPLFDDAFVAYLKYAVEEEEGRLARAGVLDDPEHNQWLFVLKIVQNGVYTELARGIQRYIDHIMYVVRMETPKERRMLLEKLIDVMPTLDVRPFVAVVNNIAGALGGSARGEFSEVAALGEMTNKILQLYRDVHELLPPERIALKAKDADEWAARKKQQLLEQRNETKKRLEAARKTEEYDEVIDMMEKKGETERFDQ